MTSFRQSETVKVWQTQQLRTYCNLRNDLTGALIEAAEMRFGQPTLPHVPSIAALNFSPSSCTRCPRLFFIHLFRCSFYTLTSLSTLYLFDCVAINTYIHHGWTWTTAPAFP